MGRINCQKVEYLSSSNAKAEDGGEEIVVITIRPDEGSYRPHNIAMSRTQAERLLNDLKRLLIVTPLVIFCFLAVGCSAKVDVSTVNKPEVQKTDTHVVVDFLSTRAEAPPEKEKPPPAETASLIIYGDDNVVINGDIHIHEHHNHEYLYILDLSPKSETVPESRQPESSPPVTIDLRCERLRLEHEKRVEKWQAMMEMGHR